MPGLWGMLMPILGKLVWTFLVYALIEANEKMWNFANSTNCSSDQKKTTNNYLDMLKIFENCDEKQILKPR